MENKVITLCKGDIGDNNGHIIKIIEDIEFPEGSSKEDIELFFDEQGKELGLALVEALPARTLAATAAVIIEVLDRMLELNRSQTEKLSNQEGENENN